MVRAMDRETLTAELEAALLRELRAYFDWENHARFRSRLTPPVFALSGAQARLGQWLRATRTIELSRALVVERPWHEVLGVLQHEMAHQFVDEVLGVRGESAHGETFQRVCEERGIDARAAGAATPAPAGAEAAAAAAVDRVLERIRKLLALAGSSNQHEAEIAMRKAHELMLRHNVEAAAARGERSFEVRHLGDPLRRATRVEADIVSLLSQFFFVKVIRVPVYLPLHGRRGLVYEILGTRANVEMASHVYAFLLATAERLWQENRGDRRVRSGRDRLQYQSGVVRGFHEKLDAERTELRGTGLVWVRDAKLDEAYHARHPRITTARRRVRVSSAHAAGREAGRTVVLHKPVERGPSAASPRLLRG
jgi:predicted SprT family Zn-dependent metalloprotease